MTKSSALPGSPRRNAALLALTMAAFATAASCNRDNSTIILDADEPVAAVSTESAPTPDADVVPAAEPAVAEPVVAEPAPAPAAAPAPVAEASAQAEPSPALVPPKFDAKGVSVDFNGSGVFNGFQTAEDKAKQSGIKVVRGSGPITAEGLKAFAQFPSLVEFLWTDAQLEDSAAAADAFKAFAAAPKLRKLRLTALRDAKGAFPTYVFPALAAAPSLADIDISGSPAAPKDFENVDFNAGFGKLEKINLYQTKLGDASLALLMPLSKRLTSLNVDDSGITADAAPLFAAYENLTFLHVGRSQLDDAAVESIAKLAKLEKVHVTRSNITEAGADKLRAALPNCTVVSVPEN